MPKAPASTCPCGGRRINGKCDRCGPRKDARKHAAARGYDYQWQKFREQYLAYHPLCVDCEREGRATGATDIHHIRKLAEYPALKYEEENLMGLCKRHHDERTGRGE